MLVLGYNGGLDGYPSRFDSSHDSAAALVIDGQVVAACEEERFTRRKHTGEFPRLAMEYCLREGGLRGFQDLDLIVYFNDYPLMFGREMVVENRSGFSRLGRLALGAGLGVMRGFNRLADYSNARNERVFARHTGHSPRAGQYRVVPHHLCHVASTFYASPFSEALCLAVDAQGESASGTAMLGRDASLTLLGQTFAPNSLGYLYAMITKFLGFDPHDEYKVMGLAPYGDPAAYREFFRTILRVRPDGWYEVDPGLMMRLILRDAMCPAGSLYPSAMVRALGPARLAFDAVSQCHMDVAAALQEALEDAMLGTLRHLQAQTGQRNLCMAGGVALNCSMNGKIARSGLFERIFIQPAAHDAGNSLGAALYGYHELLGQPRRPAPRNRVYLGPGAAPGSIESALREFGEKILHTRPEHLYRHVTRQIAAGKVVGWYQGRMEWGPRALGNRSILADARRDDMKDIVNHAVKLREGFRPFAPACLAEHAAAWFDMTGLEESPYMLFCVPVREDRRALIPAVTHVDGSARVQTVSEQDNPGLHALLRAFHRRTGVPILLNTSFNVKGEPIVNTPADAVRCFLGTQIDLLVLGDVVIEKRLDAEAELERARSRRPADVGRVINGRIAAL